MGNTVRSLAEAKQKKSNRGLPDFLADYPENAHFVAPDHSDFEATLSPMLRDQFEDFKKAALKSIGQSDASEKAIRRARYFIDELDYRASAYWP